MAKATKSTKPQSQPTIVHVKVVTDGPVPMKAVREWVEMEIGMGGIGAKNIAGQKILSVSVKRDANIERPRQ